MKPDMNKLRARLARGPKHMQRFDPLLKIALDALDNAGIPYDQHYTNQIKFKNGWVGKYKHPDKATGRMASIGVYDQGGNLIVEIRNQAEAEQFAKMMAFAKAVA